MPKGKKQKSLSSFQNLSSRYNLTSSTTATTTKNKNKKFKENRTCEEGEFISIRELKTLKNKTIKGMHGRYSPRVVTATVKTSVMLL